MQSIPHGTDRPIGTVTTKDRHALIDTARAVDDCGFRMLEPYEVAAAMAFPEHYIPRTLPKKDQGLGGLGEPATHVCSECGHTFGCDR